MDTFTSSTKDRLELILIALCCHHRCDWNVYVGKDYLLEHGFTAEEFSLLCGLSSWATCGTGLPRNPKPKEDLKSEEENVHVDRYDRLKLPRIEREEIGRRCKRVIDMGRCHYVRDKIGLPNTRLAFYVDLSYTLENVFLLAKN
jgi:tRNA:m4X modification enzyme